MIEGLASTRQLYVQPQRAPHQKVSKSCRSRPEGSHAAGLEPTRSFQVGCAILTEVELGFLVLSVPNVMSWAYQLNFTQRFMQFAWWMSFFLGATIALCSIGVTLLGEGLITMWNR